MQKSLINPEDTSKSLSTRVMEVLGGGVEAKAWNSWHLSIKPRWCGWYPCGIRIWVGKHLWNHIVARANAWGAWGAGIWGGGIITAFLSKFTWVCGSLAWLCNALIWSTGARVAHDIAYRKTRFETYCRQHRWAQGMEFSISRSGGIRSFWCANK